MNVSAKTHGSAAEEREDREAQEGHPRDAGRQRDERAHDRHHAREEDGRLAVLANQRSAGRELLGRDVQLSAVPLDQLDAAEVADAVGDPRADEVRERADERRGQQRVLASGDVEAGEQHRRLGRDRDARALERHQHEHAGEPDLVDDVGREVGERLGDRGEDEHRRSLTAPWRGALRVLPASRVASAGGKGPQRRTPHGCRPAAASCPRSRLLPSRCWCWPGAAAATSPRARRSRRRPSRRR